jgi:hypothetical protein
VQHDLETSFVDDHVVMEPAEDHQLTLVGPPTLSPRCEVMDLETMPARAAISGTCETGFSQQRPFQSGRRRSLPTAVIHEPSVVSPGSDLDIGVAQDRPQGLPADTGAGVEDDSGLTV